MARGRQRGDRAPRRGRGTLAVIGALLLASAALRLAGGIDRVLASPATAAEEQPGPGQAPDDIDAAALLEALDARESRLAEREREMQLRMQALKVAETQIDARMTALVEAEEKLRATLDIARSAAENDLAQLTDVYARMKPKNAAALFEEMAPEFAAGFLGRMKPEAAAAILAGLTPEKAYTISVLLAGRNADAPKP
ncbi:MotE family protein [Roseivivax isoporae]|uniref:Magnesium transporter MgtE intracellular domain-containing protein n=1 Tax=Roseivivax isoporae LMG 25204 TaxID=1449351 RepID=X7FAA5_9RHOB|nr:hypothetical protein [Roseivivax isoporae]ETX29638.1 hypothetical protein RISW2_22400 [Roseivivax isoporae LMG 25204]